MTPPQGLSLSDITTVLHDIRWMNTHESLVQTKSIQTCIADFPCIKGYTKYLVFPPFFFFSVKEN